LNGGPCRLGTSCCLSHVVTYFATSSSSSSSSITYSLSTPTNSYIKTSWANITLLSPKVLIIPKVSLPLLLLLLQLLLSLLHFLALFPHLLLLLLHQYLGYTAGRCLRIEHHAP
jgi:hypothetical protein